MLKEALTDTWTFFKLHYMALSAIILPIVIPVDVLSAFYQHSLEGKEFGVAHMVPILLKVVVNPLYSVGIVFYIASVIKGEVIDTKTAWQLGIKYWMPYLILSILVGLSVGTGLMLLVIPGIIFLVRFSFSEFELLLNNNKPLDALKNSWNGTRKYMFEILGGFTAIAVVLFLPYFTIMNYFDEMNTFYWIINTILGIVYSVLEVLFTIYAFRIFDNTREQEVLNR